MNFRRQITPDMLVETDDTECIILRVVHPAAGYTIRIVTLSNVDALKAALDDARAYVRAMEDA